MTQNLPSTNLSHIASSRAKKDQRQISESRRKIAADAVCLHGFMLLLACRQCTDGLNCLGWPQVYDCHSYTQLIIFEVPHCHLWHEITACLLRNLTVSALQPAKMHIGSISPPSARDGGPFLVMQHSHQAATHRSFSIMKAPITRW